MRVGTESPPPLHSTNLSWSGPSQAYGRVATPANDGLTGWLNLCLDETVRRANIWQGRQRLEIRLFLPIFILWYTTPPTIDHIQEFAIVQS